VISTPQHKGVTIQHTTRSFPKNRHGQVDEWSALIELQNQSADKREKQKKAEEHIKKK
jgi:hypothetical protein